MVYTNPECTGIHTSLKIRSIPTDGEQKAQNEEWWPEILTSQSQLTIVPNEHRDSVVVNSTDRFVQAAKHLVCLH